MARHTFELKGKNQPLVRHDRVIHATEPVLAAIRLALDVAPNSTKFHVHLVDNRGHAFRPPPLRDKGWVGVRFEHKLARRIEFPQHDNLMFSWLGDEIKLCHRSPPYFSARPEGYPSDRILPPLDGG